MSKLNCFRAINLNYNNNTMRIEDETFHFEGENTLLSLQNGGGKSVLVQMMIAPFVRKRYRDTPDRTFASFFTTNRPTFLLTEWILDGGAGYVLVGMMVRQKQVSGEDARDELEIVNFIHEYKEPNQFDIHSIPVIESDKNVKKLKGFNACRLLLEDIKKEKGISFLYFDLNQPHQQRNYFERLKEFKIDHTEWEAIIKKVNLKESGLSELFKDAKDEAGLVEKWFLSAVESKLNKDENRMKEFANIIHKFILQYKENQSKIERKDTIISFQADADIIRESTEEANLAKLNKQEYEEKIAYLRECLQSLLSERYEERATLEETLSLLEEQLQSIHYEESSYQLYCLMDELEVLVKRLGEKDNEKEQVQGEKQDLEFLLNTMECARIYEEYRECSGEVLLLENKLEVLRSQEKDLMPERNQLGYNLKCYYEGERDKQKIYLKEQEELLFTKREKLKNLTIKEEQEQRQAQEINQSFGQTKARISAYDKEEMDFNIRYVEKLERNILGVYEEATLDIRKVQYKDNLEDLHRSLTQLKNRKEELDESMISCSRDMEDGNTKSGELKQQLAHQKEIRSDYEEQLDVRKIILRFIGLGEEELFQVPTIEDTFERKLKELGLVKRTLERKKEKLAEEYYNLASGKVLDLPKEFSRLLSDMNLSYVYGMDWLKKNGNSTKANQELLKQNPMLPFSIIMSGQELKRLADAQINFYTSFPIPIIRREDLAVHNNADANCVYEINKVSFFVMFNHHLLDENALKDLLLQKQAEIDKAEKSLNQKEDEIAEYEGKYNKVKYQTVTETSYHKCISELELLKQQIADTEQSLNGLRNQKEKLQRQQKDIVDEIDHSKQQESLLVNKLRDFEQLQDRYEEYLDQRRELDKLTKNSEKLALSMEECKHDIRGINQFIQDTTLNRERENIKLEQLQRKVNEYQSYREDTLLNKDIEDIEARFEALTKKISEDQQELEKKLEREQDRFEKKQNQLLAKESQYNLTEQDYKEVKPDDFREQETRKELSICEDKLQLLQTQYNEISKKIAVKEHQLQEGKHQLEERFQRTELIPRSQITDLEFIKRAKLISIEMQKEKDKLKHCEDKIQSYENNLSNLAEFDHLTTNRSFRFEDELAGTDKNDLKELETKELVDFRGRLVRDYRRADELKDEKREVLRKCMEEIVRKKTYEEEFFKKPIETMLQLINEPQGVLEQLRIILSSFQALLEKLEVDIDIVEKERQKVIEMLLDYICDIHKNLGKIDRNSTITIRERSIKMLKIKLPEWEEQQSTYQLKMQDFMEELISRGLNRLSMNENIEEMIGAFVTTRNLYDTIVGIGNIGIKLYKIEAQREYPITWAEVAKNSGGEGFLSAFVVLSSLLSYMRRDETDLFSEREEGKVLVMDNPFAQTNAAHLLKPLMDVAKKNNTQLICLSGLGGESIYNRFDNIYVLNLMGSGFHKDIQYLKGEHLKGEKNIITIRASQVKVEEMEQMELLF